jgi:predicted MFS family arabinose efflux permease
MVIAGPAQALSNPMTNRVIMQRVAADKRARWIGVKQSGVQASQLFAGLFFPSVALLAGWQGAAAAAAGVALALMLWSWNRIQARPATSPTVKAATGTKPEHAARLPAAVWILTGYSLFCGAGLQATNVYLPLFAHREIGVGLLLAGLTAVLSGIVGVSSRVFWGRKMNTGARTSLLLALLAAGALLGTTFLLASGAFNAQPLMWLGIALHGATALGGNVVVMAGLMHTVPAGRVGAASGIVALGLYSGFALGPLMMGILLGQSGNFFSGWIMVGASYVLCIVLALTLTSRRQRHAGSLAPSAGRNDIAAVQPRARCGE